MFNNKIIKTVLRSVSYLSLIVCCNAMAVKPLDSLQDGESAGALRVVENLINESFDTLPSELPEGRNIFGAADSPASNDEDLSQTIRRDRPLHLLTERRPGKLKSGELRKANVYYYDYQADETLHYIIELQTNRVVEVVKMTGVQLPLTILEIETAVDIVMSSAEFKKELSRAFELTTGQPFSEKSQVDYKAFVFDSETIPSGLNSASKLCGEKRCAQLLIYTSGTNVALDFSPIVDISNQKVTQLLEAAPSIQSAPLRSRASQSESSSGHSHGSHNHSSHTH